MSVPPEYNIITKDEEETAARFLRILIWARDAAQQGKLPKRHIPHFTGWTTEEGVSAKWRGWDFTLYDKRGEIACFNSDLSPSLAFRGIESVDVRHGGLANLNNLTGAGALGRVLYLISQRTWEQLSHSHEHYYLIEQLLEEEGIEVGTRPLPGPPSSEPSAKKRPGSSGLPGINFPRIKAHVESTRYKEPGAKTRPKTEPKTEPKPAPTLEWGDYSALIEAIERADPKRKPKKPTPPPKPEKSEPARKRRNLWGWALIAFELLAIVWICHIYATQGPYSPELGATCAVAALTSTVGIAVLRSTDDSDERKETT